MVRGSLIFFIAGWTIWFWLDKSPFVLGPLPQPLQGEYLANFQMAFDLLKEGRFRAAYVYIWKGHFVVISLAFGMLAAMVASSFSRMLARKRFRKLNIPEPDQPAGSDTR